MAKSILTQAMLDAEEISNASLENAKNLVIETFAPKLTDLIRAKLNEEDDLEDEVFDDETDSEEDVTEESEDPTSDDEETVDETVCDDEMDEEIDLDIEDDEEELPTEEDIPSDETSDDEELDVPEELFDDEEDVTEETDDMEDTFPAEEDDEELPVESDEIPGDEEIDLDIEDDEELPVEGDEEMTDDDEELPMEEEMPEDEDGLYIKKEGKLTKVTPTQALQARISELEEERDRATKAVGLLSTQIKEVNLFNAKLAYSNKLFNSRSYTSKQKIKIAEQLDRAKTVKQVKTLAEQISKIELPKAKKHINANPLVEYRQRIASNKKVVSESVYESDDVARMRRLSGIID